MLCYIVDFYYIHSKKFLYQSCVYSVDIWISVIMLMLVFNQYSRNFPSELVVIIEVKLSKVKLLATHYN